MNATTVIGTLIDASGKPLLALIAFRSLSTPQAGNPLVECSSILSVTSNTTDGTFSQLLEAGNYAVTITPQDVTQPATNFTIAVLDNAGTVQMATLITTSLVTLPGAAPNTLWNNILTGNITVQPVTNPGQFTTAPVNNVSGHQSGASAFNYRIAWVTPTGVTLPNPLDVANTPPTGSNNATRITLPTPPTGVTQVNIYRSNDGTSTRWLLATVAAASAFYDDWESAADFITAGVATLPTYNSTAGGIVMQSGNVVAYFTDKGIEFPNELFPCRISQGKGFQLYDPTTGLWYTLSLTGSPPTITLDSGNAP